MAIQRNGVSLKWRNGFLIRSAPRVFLPPFWEAKVRCVCRLVGNLISVGEQ